MSPTRGQRSMNVLVAIVGGQNDELCMWILRTNVTNHFYAALARHPQVNYGNVWLKVCKLLDRLLTVCSLADYLNAARRTKEFHNTLSHQVVVFCNEYSN